MSAESLASYLSTRQYPGRGVFVGRAGERIVVGIFLTGRSEASRARTIARNGDSFDVLPTDETAVDDPLRHYQGVIADGSRLIAGNGRHVSELATAGCDPADAKCVLGGLTFEPDPPLFTPRLSAVVSLSQSPTAILGIAARGPNGQTRHQLMELESLGTDELWLLHTYSGPSSSPDSSGFMAQLPGPAPDLGAVRDMLDPGYRVAVGSVTASLGSQWADGNWDRWSLTSDVSPL
jgi:IMP cyclohydrolase